MNLIRRIVSGQKKRFQHGPDGFDLDLAYIAPRVIAMGLPAVQGKEVLYRNPMQEIARFLQTYHRGHAKVYNLCSEHTYSAQHLSVAVQQYPYDDHQTPPLAMVQQFCADAAAWLAADPVNVVVVHCKAGKGRTGIMICSLLLYLHKNAPDLANLAPSAAGGVSTHPTAASALAAPALQQQQSAAVGCSCSAEGEACQAGGPCSSGASCGLQHQQCSSRLWHPWQQVPPVQLRQLEQPARDVLDMYAERRTHDGNGVTIKSQRRYVGYFWAVLCSGPGPEGMLPTPRTVQLRQVTISGLPPGTADSCELLVEARPSGSLAPRATAVCRRAAPRAPTGAVTGFCMVPCTHAPLVQDDGCCVSTSPHGDTLTFRMPAASMGLSSLTTLQQSSLAAAAGAISLDPAQQHGQQVSAAVDASAAGACGGCVSCGASAASCTCWACQGALPGVVPAAEQAEEQPGSAAAAVRCPTSSSGEAGLAEDCWDASEQAGCCVVEGDVRLLLRRGSTKLCYTWFNTAFLPPGGCYTLTRAQLDKPSKSLPRDLTLTVRFVESKPTVEGEEGLSAEKQPGQQLELEQQQQKAPWLFGFQEPPLETSNKPAKGSAQQQGKQQRGKALSLLAEAVPSGQGLIGTACSPVTAHVGGAAGADSQHGAVQRHVRSSSAEAQLFAPAAQAAVQHQPRPCSATEGGQASVVPISASAPASPQGRKLRSSGSWRHHLPAISSISTSALLWGSAEGTGAAPRKSPRVDVARQESPHSWCGSAARSWDWDTLAAFCDAEDGLGCAAAPAPGSSAGSGAAGFRIWGASSSNRDGSSSGRHRGGAILQQDLHSSAVSRAAVPGLVPSQASIELPVIVKRPSGVNSLVDALLDPEHSASSQTSTAAAAAAAAAASGRVLASEASSSAVAGHAAAAGYKPPGQLRKGYSWHGSSSWFAAMAASAGNGSSSPAASHSSSSVKPGGRRAQTDQRRPGQQAGAWSAPDLAPEHEEHLGLAVTEASMLGLEPLLLCERSSAVPGSVLSSCDPVQGLLEALNWSTDVQRYHAPEQRSKPPARRRSTSSEPCSPKRGGGLLPTVMSSPALHSCRSAPATPEQSAAPSSSPMQDAAGLQPQRPELVAQRQVRPSSRGSDSGHSGSRRRPRVSRADVCRLLDLEDWAEDEAEGLDGGEAAAAPAAHAKGAAAADSPAVSAGGALLGVPPPRHPSSDAAAAADPVGPAPKRTQRAARTRKPAGAAPPASTQGRGSSGAAAAAACDESSLGLLAADGPSAPSCGAQAPPALLQQWQQLEKAWQKSWWV